MPLPLILAGLAGYTIKKTIFKHTPIGSLAESFVDNVIRDKVTPAVGSIVHCSLFGAEHTGVYIGHEKIVHLEGTGQINTTTRSGFISGTNAMTIYIACNGTTPLGSKKTAERAKEQVDASRNYNVIMDNCHQFTAGCISGDFDNASNFFWMVEGEIRKNLNSGNSITWRAWDINY